MVITTDSEKLPFNLNEQYIQHKYWKLVLKFLLFTLLGTTQLIVARVEKANMHFLAQLFECGCNVSKKGQDKYVCVCIITANYTNSFVTHYQA